MITATWLNSISNSPERLSTVIAFLNWGIVMTLVCGGILTAFVILAGNQRDVLLKAVEVQKDQRIAEANKVAAQANQRAAEANSQSASASQKIAEANARMEEARANAALAVEGQKRLEVEAERARQAQKQLELQSADSRKEQEKLHKQNLELQSQVEKERTARLLIEERLKPRRLSPQQRATLGAAARSVHGVAIRITAVLGDAEGLQYAHDFSDVLTGSGWTIEGGGPNQAVFTPTRNGDTGQRF